MIQMNTSILSNKQLNQDRWQRVLNAPHIASEFKPGQFIHTKVGGSNGPLFKRPFRQFETPVIVNIAGENVEEFVKITEILNQADGIAGIEINLGCPNLSLFEGRFLIGRQSPSLSLRLSDTISLAIWGANPMYSSGLSKRSMSAFVRC